jgi:hypothetical protein
MIEEREIGHHHVETPEAVAAKLKELQLAYVDLWPRVQIAEAVYLDAHEKDVRNDRIDKKKELDAERVGAAKIFYKLSGELKRIEAEMHALNVPDIDSYIESAQNEARALK